MLVPHAPVQGARLSPILKCLFALFVTASAVPDVFAQTPADAGRPSLLAQVPEAVAEMQAPIVTVRTDGRACDGCPPRRLGTAFLQATYVNVFYELANLIRGQDTAKITPETWWTNMKRGWEFDLDDFAVNQIGHPYQGNNYFTTGRANGLSFWESAGLTAFGSGTWEFFGETNQASLNDFINTTLGGIALGEMFHRTAWLIRDPRTSSGRKKREIAALAIDPMTGINRFLTGDASRISEKPADMVPSALGAIASAGILTRGSGSEGGDWAVKPFVEIDVVYGDPTTGRSRTPYDAFAVELDIGGGSALSEVRVRGRLLGQPYRDGTIQLTVAQGYQYNNNEAYQFGAQSAEAGVSVSRALSPNFTLWGAGWGGVTILGAVDSVPLPESGQSIAPEEPEEEAGQGVSTGPRFYDYGPGGNFGGFVDLQRNGRSFLRFEYDAHHLYVLDGVRANHFLQRVRSDLRIPLRGRLGVGVTGEFFDRRTFYQVPGVTRARFHYPQFRAFLTWTAS